jgi:hypothetical protein
VKTVAHLVAGTKSASLGVRGTEISAVQVVRELITTASAVVAVRSMQAPATANS